MGQPIEPAPQPREQQTAKDNAFLEEAVCIGHPRNDALSVKRGKEHVTLAVYAHRGRCIKETCKRSHEGSEHSTGTLPTCMPMHVRSITRYRLGGWKPT